MASKTLSKNINITIINNCLVVAPDCNVYDEELLALGGVFKKKTDSWIFNKKFLFTLVEWVNNKNAELDNRVPHIVSSDLANSFEINTVQGDDECTQGGTSSDHSDKEAEEWRCDACNKWIPSDLLNSSNMCKKCVKNNKKRKHQSNYRTEESSDEESSDEDSSDEESSDEESSDEDSSDEDSSDEDSSDEKSSKKNPVKRRKKISTKKKNQVKCSKRGCQVSPRDKKKRCAKHTNK
jgi:hypothetical protein